MNKIILLARANIRKTKAQTFTLVLLFIIASMLMNIGLMISLNFGTFYKNTAEELNTTDAYYIIPELIYNEEVENFIKSHEETELFAKNSGIITTAKMEWLDNDMRVVLFFDKNESRPVSEWKLVSETLPETKDSVYLPYQLKANGKYELGDTITLDFNENTHDFIIAGFTEDLYFSTYDMVVIGFYLPSERFK
jgi:putative ABC transport system permease protein